MIVGFNHNIMYQGSGFHVQTEDSGLKSPSLVTLLYHGGIIVSSQKTSYADILDVDNLSNVVEELAKEQHKGMLRRLTKGEFDQRICELGIKPDPDPAALETSSPQASAAREAAPLLDVALEAEVQADEEPSGPAPAEAPVAIEPAYESPAGEDRPQSLEAAETLDSLIYSYLTGGNTNC